MILGHRGGRGEGWPVENTLAAFARAQREGADGVELDVRLSGAGEVVVLHDVTLERVSNGADVRPVASASRASMPLLGGEPIPTLAEALEALRGSMVNVEVKSDVPDRLALARAVAKTARAASGVEILFSSFDPRVLAALWAFAPEVPRAILVGPTTPRLATLTPLLMRAAIVAAHLEDAMVTKARVRLLSRLGLRVAAWTVNDEARAREIVAAGAPWIITDRPGAVAAALIDRR